MNKKCPYCKFYITIDPISDWGSEGKMLRHILFEHEIKDFIIKKINKIYEQTN